MRRRAAALILAAYLLSVLTACGAPAPQASEAAPPDSPAETQTTPEKTEETEETGPLSPVDGMTVALIPAGTGGKYDAAATKKAQQYAARWGLKLLLMEDADKEAAVRRAMDAGVNGLCVAAADEALAAPLREANAAGIPAAVWNSETLTGMRALRVSRGTAEQFGRMLVEMGVSSLADRGAALEEDAEVKYLWFCSENGDGSAWHAAGKSFIRERYPNWTEIDAPQSAGTSAEEAEAAALAMLDEYAYADLIFCTDGTALTALCKAVQSRQPDAQSLTITGICAPEPIEPYLQDGVCARCGYWDDGLQCALACYLAAWLGGGNAVRVGDIVSVPLLGSLEVFSNETLSAGQTTEAENDGVVLLPERIVLTAENIADYCIKEE